MLCWKTDKYEICCDALTLNWSMYVYELLNPIVLWSLPLPAPTICYWIHTRITEVLLLFLQCFQLSSGWLSTVTTGSLKKTGIHSLQNLLMMFINKWPCTLATLNHIQEWRPESNLICHTWGKVHPFSCNLFFS